ncbi:MAG TPA: hypothetical protein VF092_09800 [Longimicrobium sp.]
MHLPLRTALRRTPVLPLLLCAAAACGDAPTASRIAQPAPRHDGATASTLRRPALIANTVRYRDLGHHPATGRSGSVSLAVQALLGHDGSTEMEVRAFAQDWLQRPVITHLQLKALTPDGRMIGTRVYGPGLTDSSVASPTVGGLARGTQLQVMATVTGADRNRTDVPTITGTVWRRPNLAVRDLSAPARVRQGRSALVTATVAETNGDLGAVTSCQLYLDGVAQDWAQGVWVDAGDAVTCLFWPTFRSAGTHRVEVRLGGAWPRDDDPADNSASAEVEVETSNELVYSAVVSGSEGNSYRRSRESWTFGDSVGSQSGNEYGDETRSVYANRTTSASGYIQKGMSRLPRVEVEEESGGVPVVSGAYELALTYDYGGDLCGYGSDGATGVLVTACTHTGEFPFTNAWYSRMSTNVSYHSVSYMRVWDDRSGNEFVYHFNYDQDFVGGLPLAPLGADYTVRMRLVDGETEFHGAATFPVQVSEFREEWPWTCSTNSYWWAAATMEYCSTSQSWTRNLYGSGYSGT